LAAPAEVDDLDRETLSACPTLRNPDAIRFKDRQSQEGKNLRPIGPWFAAGLKTSFSTAISPSVRCMARTTVIAKIFPT
jgi:hypothetical protein